MRKQQVLIGLLWGLIVPGSLVLGDVVTYSGALTATRDQFNIDSDGLALLENFESFGGGQAVGDMPGNAARFAPEYADG